MVTIAFRFDDPAFTSNHQLMDGIFDACFSRHIPLSCAVTPVRHDQGGKAGLFGIKAGVLRQGLTSGLLDISQHGYLHRNSNGQESHGPSEFHNMPLDLQRGWIRTGKAILEDTLACRISGFVPPWNSYDATTVQALEEQGFTYLSADRNRLPHPGSPLRFLPITCGLQELASAMRQARKFACLDPIIIASVRSRDFGPMSGASIPSRDACVNFDALLDELVEQPDLWFANLSQLAGQLTPWQGRLWGKQHSLISALPERLKPAMPRQSLVTRLLPYPRSRCLGPAYIPPRPIAAARHV